MTGEGMWPFSFPPTLQRRYTAGLGDANVDVPTYTRFFQTIFRLSDTAQSWRQVRGGSGQWRQGRYGAVVAAGATGYACAASAELWSMLPSPPTPPCS